MYKTFPGADFPSSDQEFVELKPQNAFVRWKGIWCPVLQRVELTYMVGEGPDDMVQVNVEWLIALVRMCCVVALQR